jgi:hypothetical protein
VTTGYPVSLQLPPVVMGQQPECITGGELRDYQVVSHLFLL